MSGRFFFVCFFAFGTASALPDVVEEAAAGVGAGLGACLRALNAEMKSTAKGVSPRRLLKWLTASSFESVLA